MDCESLTYTSIAAIQGGSSPGITSLLGPEGTFASQLNCCGHHNQAHTHCNLLYWLHRNASLKVLWGQNPVGFKTASMGHTDATLATFAVHIKCVF